MILTGPNMGGNRRTLRRAALLCLMAQAGSFVPAKSAKIPLVDRLFARVGAPTASRAASRRSWECRRRPISPSGHIAQSRRIGEIAAGPRRSTAEHRLGGRRIPRDSSDHGRRRSSTHYHEWRTRRRDVGHCELPRRGPRVENDIVFLRKIVPGGPTAVTASRSRGWRACRQRSLPRHARFCRPSNRTSCHEAGDRR
jgi:DNA mismatch repair protein MutS